MAKVIGAEGQRNLSYNLARRERKDERRRAETAQERASMGKQLQMMSMDKDIDDPSLGYLAGAVQADPTGPIGGLAQAFGSIRLGEAMETKKSAIAGRDETDALFAQNNAREIFGDEVVDDLNTQMDPENNLQKDPEYWGKLFQNLQDKEDATVQKQENDLYLRRMKGEENELIAFEKSQAGLKTYLKEIAPDMDEGTVEWITSKPEYLSDFFRDNIRDNISKSKLSDMWDSDPYLQSMFPSKDLFLNIKEYPEGVAVHIMQQGAALNALPNWQGLHQKLTDARTELSEASAQSIKQAEEAAFPTSVDGRPTLDYMKFFVEYAMQTEDGDDIDEDDSLNDQYNQAAAMLQGAENQGLPSLYVQTKVNEARNNETYDNRVGPYIQGAMAQPLANIDTIQRQITEWKQRNPGLPVGAVMNFPTQKVQDAKSRRLPPGSIFRGANGGLYITLAKPGQPPPSSVLNGLSVPFDGVAPSGGSLSGSYGGLAPQQDFLDDGASLTADSLNKHGVSYVRHSKGPVPPVNGGYRQLTEKEAEMAKFLDSQLMPTRQVPTVPSDKTSAHIQGTGKASRNVTTTQPPPPSARTKASNLRKLQNKQEPPRAQANRNLFRGNR